MKALTSTVCFTVRIRLRKHIRHTSGQDHKLEISLDARLLPKLLKSIEAGEAVTLTTDICNVNRTAGTQISAEIVRRYGAEGLPDDTVHLEFHGTAGQSFGAFCLPRYDA